jgi:hypothetical protein
MNRLFPHTTLKQSIIFLLLWIVGHWIAGFIIFWAFVSVGSAANSDLWIVVCWSLFTGLGFTLTQKLLLKWFGKRINTAINLNISITALLALIGGCFGYLIFQIFDRNEPIPSVSWGLFCIVIALPPIIGHWRKFRLHVCHAWLWLVAGVLLLASYDLFLVYVLSLLLDEGIGVFGLIVFPVVLPISGVTMLFLINSPRFGKEKRKNDVM